MKKLVSILLVVMLLGTQLVFAGEKTSGDGPVHYTFAQLTNLPIENVEKVSIGCSKCGLGLSEYFITSPLIISDIFNTFKDMDFVEDTRDGSAGGWVYGINFYMKDGTYIQFGTRLHIDKVDYNAVDSVTVLERMAYYHDLIEDIDSSEWATDYILECQELGFLEGITDISYKEPITREKFCELAVNMLEIGKVELDASISDDYQNVIQDTQSESVQKLYNAGIVQGKHYTKSGIVFEPNALITREESATILWRIVCYMNLEIPQSFYDEDIEYYYDKDNISDFAFDAVFYMHEMGIMKGTSEKEFSAKNSYTTEQAITTLVRVYSLSQNQPMYSDISVPVFRIVDKDGNIIITEKDIIFCNAGKRIYNNSNVETYIQITLSDEGVNVVKEATGKIAEYPSGENYIEVIVDKQSISKPVIYSEMNGKVIAFSCDYTLEEVIKFANIVKSQLR